MWALAAAWQSQGRCSAVRDDRSCLQRWGRRRGHGGLRRCSIAAVMWTRYVSELDEWLCLRKPPHGEGGSCEYCHLTAAWKRSFLHVMGMRHLL